MPWDGQTCMTHDRLLPCVECEVTDEMVERAAQAICEQGIRAMDGGMATWERHAAGFRDMARVALTAALQDKAGRQEGR